MLNVLFDPICHALRMTAFGRLEWNLEKLCLTRFVTRPHVLVHFERVVRAVTNLDFDMLPFIAWRGGVVRCSQPTRVYGDELGACSVDRYPFLVERCGRGAWILFGQLLELALDLGCAFDFHEGHHWIGVP